MADCLSQISLPLCAGSAETGGVAAAMPAHFRVSGQVIKRIAFPTPGRMSENARLGHEQVTFDAVISAFIDDSLQLAEYFPGLN